jgi:exopolysaccharide biosynthesis protein
MRSYSVRARPRRLATVLVAASLLSVVAAAPGYADPPGAISVATAVPTAGAATGIETARSTRPVAPGVTLTSLDRYDATGWLRTDSLSTDLAGGARVGYLSSGEVSKVEPIRASADRTRAVAAVNGDYFDINNSGAALGVGIQSGQMVQSPVSDHNNAVGITASGIGEVVQVYFEGSATLPSGGTVALTQFNNMVQADGVGLFTPVWGSYPRSRAVAGATRVTEVTLVDGRVSTVSATAGSGSIPAGATVLLGRDAGADALAGLAVGDPVSVSYRPRSSDGQALSTAVGGRNILVRDGVPQDISGDTTLEPRTALGFSADGRRMFITTVDGKQVDSRGVTLTEMGQLMAESGAYQALELDGGGSSTLLARKPGGSEVKVENSPSDGSERPVANGLAIYAPVGSGRLTGFWVETAIDPATAPGDAPVRGGRPDRVFPGLTRQLTAAGYDETYGPAAGKPQWSVDTPWRGRVDRDGVFHAGTSGTATVTASGGRGARGQITLTVLGPLARLRSTAERVALRDQASTASFGLVGSDAEGTSAPIEPADARLDYDHSLFQITPGANGTFEVHGSKPYAAGLVTVHAGGISTAIPVTIGLDDQLVAGFDDAASWTFSQARASGSVTPVAGHTGTGLKMSYDYTRSTATRAAYANPPAIVDIPGQPLAQPAPDRRARAGPGAARALPDLDRLAADRVRGARRHRVPAEAAPVLYRGDQGGRAVHQRHCDRRHRGQGAATGHRPGRTGADRPARGHRRYGGRRTLAVRGPLRCPVRRARPGQRDRPQCQAGIARDQGGEARLPADRRRLRGRGQPGGSGAGQADPG